MKRALKSINHIVDNEEQRSKKLDVVQITS